MRPTTPAPRPDAPAALLVERFDVWGHEGSAAPALTCYCWRSPSSAPPAVPAAAAPGAVAA
ncbi:MAG: hypothetical protein NTW05_18500 [Pseudonocardiales bacterium]|jgi:hypothetical protein|nr:hypothetical protein [Pseudonocardiales bacterium]